MLRIPIQLAALLTTVGASNAQERVVDQMFDDVDPLADSFRQFQPDLREDTGFERLYEDPRFPGWYFRKDGAVTAFMPQGDYIATREGIVPLIPAGTIFFIGEPAPDQLPPLPGQPLFPSAVPPSRESAGKRVQLAMSVVGTTPGASTASQAVRSTRIVARQGEELVTLSEAHEMSRTREPIPAIMREDTLYRATRLRDIMQQAVDPD